MQQPFILGPLQEMWLKSLEEHPEKQAKTFLGYGTPEKYRACCLGEALLCIHRFENTPLPFGRNGHVMDTADTVCSLSSFKKIGLKGSTGSLREDVILKGSTYSSLAAMNDCGITWPEIAAFIRADPTMVFNESI